MQNNAAFKYLFKNFQGSANKDVLKVNYPKECNGKSFIMLFLQNFSHFEEILIIVLSKSISVYNTNSKYYLSS